MTTSWLDLMAEDSNLSMASMTSIKSSYDAEFDNSRQGVNLMFKKSVKIISDDSQSRKRTFDEMKESMDCNQENKYLPPKAKQRTNVKGDWTKRKSESNKENENEKENENKNEKIGFGRFLKWAKNTNDGDNDDKENQNKNKNKNENVLSVQLNDNKNNLIICNPTINHRKRKQFRAKRRNKNLKPFEKNQQSDSQSIMTKIEEEQQENMKDMDMEIDIDMDLDQTQTQKEEEPEEQKKDNNTDKDKDKDINMKMDVNVNVNVDDENENDNDQEVEVKEEEKEEKEKEDDQDRESENDEDDDLKTPIQKFTETKKRRITPTLQHVVFNTDLILNKVPILKKKDDDESQQIIKAPIFLNADQYETLNKNTVKDDNKHDDKKESKQNEQENEDENENVNANEIENEYMEENEDFDCDVWANKKTETESENKPKSWAQKLFAEKVKENKQIKEKEEALLVEKRKKERLHEIKIDSILPPQPQHPQHVATESVMFSRESSVSITTESSTTTTTTTATSTPVCNPSAHATEWRQKQISIGKSTVGYKHFIEQFPNKDLRFRLNNNLIATPDPKERIGKKRWVGKYQKWRKFLHKFDDFE